MRYLFFFLLQLSLLSLASAQIRLEGTVTDRQGGALIGANVYIKGTYDVTITDEQDQFSFVTDQEGTQILVISYLGYVSKELSGSVAEWSSLEIQLRASAASLDAVEVTASTFKAGDNAKSAVLKPLDIVTTAGSMGDVMAAMQTLPGTQSNADDGRLFIRGGDARESAIYVDGLRVFTPYTRTTVGTPARGRFSPFLFKGVSFSTGGYSAAFGQALSGVLDMQTIDEPAATATDISLMTVGLGLGHTQKWDRQSLSLSTSYTNLTPYNWIVPNRLDWEQAFRGFSGEAVYRYKTDKGLFKTYLSADRGRFSLSQKNLNTGEADQIAIQNENIYANTSFSSLLTDRTSLYAGLSTGLNQDNLGFNQQAAIISGLNGLHSRLALKTVVRDHFILNYGLDWLFQEDQIQKSTVSSEAVFKDQLSRHITAGFVETDYFLSKHLAIKAGLRTSYHTLSDQLNILPRFTLAQKLNARSQISLGYGQYSQEVNPDFLFFDTELREEKADHYLLNYNLKTDKNHFRLAAFYKDYQNLLKFQGDRNQARDLDNSGTGYAYGLDLFWRANQWIPYVDFWISYSWLQHERDYLDYPTAAMPTFSTNHNLSVVTKTWINKLNSQIGISYNMASGRPYENPNTAGFQNERSPFYHNISLSWSYLISQQKILFASVSNAPNFRNEFGYRYADIPNAKGFYESEIIRPNADQFFFVGLFITISADKSKNQLNNL